jgi:hypothetical protein
MALEGLVHILKDGHTSEQGPGGNNLLLTKSTKEIFLVWVGAAHLHSRHLSHVKSANQVPLEYENVTGAHGSHNF